MLPSYFSGWYASRLSVWTSLAEILSGVAMSSGMYAKICPEASPFVMSHGHDIASVKRMLMSVYRFGTVVSGVTGTMTDGHSDGKATADEVDAADPVRVASVADGSSDVTVSLVSRERVRVFQSSVEVGTHEYGLARRDSQPRSLLGLVQETQRQTHSLVAVPVDELSIAVALALVDSVSDTTAVPLTRVVADCAVDVASLEPTADVVAFWLSDTRVPVVTVALLPPVWLSMTDVVSCGRG